MEPSLPSSYKKTLALAHLRVILNEYWSIGKPWARSSTMQRIRSCASFIKVGVANAQMGVALKFSRAFFNRTLLWLILDPPLESSATTSHGNFWALLEFRVAAGDSVLRDHLAKAPRNAMYTSPDIQNQITDILGDHVRQKILHKVRQAQLFTVIADEVTDCSNKEQLSVVLRYVDPNDSSIPFRAFNKKLRNVFLPELMPTV